MFNIYSYDLHVTE